MTVCFPVVEDFGASVANWSRGIVFPGTRARVHDGESVLLEVRIARTKLLVPALTRYTIPERRGPVFVCGKDAIETLRFLVDPSRCTRPREFVRFPLRFPVRLRIGEDHQLAGNLVDVSPLAARVQLEVRIAPGTPLALEAPGDRAPRGFPRRLTARVIGARPHGIAVHFQGPDTNGWRQLRVLLRHATEIGIAPSSPS